VSSVANAGVGRGPYPPAAAPASRRAPHDGESTVARC